ncbi:MAG: hypothetical protein HC904_10635 [Blastochloris sp.]|nr:hypothetical protein [Blastochloris sp.]
MGDVFDLWAPGFSGGERGQVLKTGEVLGVMGWSGNVGSRDRAHLHVELGFKIHRDYAGWYEKLGRSFEPRATPNEHGNYNGLNFLGVDPVPLLLASERGKAWSVPEIFQAQKKRLRFGCLPRGSWWIGREGFPNRWRGRGTCRRAKLPRGRSNAHARVCL